MRKWSLAVILTITFIATGCAGQQAQYTTLDDDTATAQSIQSAAQALLAQDPQGPILPPSIPQNLADAAASAGADITSPSEVDGPIVSYRVVCESLDAPELKDAFMKNSSLTLLAAVPLANLTALEQRLSKALGEGKDILNSFGYYAGSVNGHMEIDIDKNENDNDTTNSQNSTAPNPKQSAVIFVSFDPGPQYHIGKTRIIRIDQATPAQLPNSGIEDKNYDTVTAMLPKTFADVGLDNEAPANAQDILDAVDRIRDAYSNLGYPQAQISATRYILDHSTQELEAEVHVAPGQYMTMGELEPRGEIGVRKSYLKALQTWQAGEPWNQSKIEEYKDALRQSGLFQNIDIEPGDEKDNAGHNPVVAVLDSALERTVGGAVTYDTSFGPGLQGFWEHRNISSNGDSLRFELSLWKDWQELTGKYRLPFLFHKNQDFIAQAGVLHQNLEAYELESAKIIAGIERRLSRHWSASIQGSAEGGWLKDPDQPRHEYMMFGLPLGANYSSANSLLDATDGGRAIFSVTPYTGKYDSPFSVVRSRLDLQRFIPLAGEDTLVLALRGSIGGLWGADATSVPPSVRFYSGGGGSVRGYDYQSLGPRNADKDPLGGSYMLETSIEPRWKISEEWGMVAFLDGGMAYEDFNSDFAQDMRWGAGIGARFYTAIGPLRFDVATPLNPRNGDSPLHFYISIGQSF